MFKLYKVVKINNRIVKVAYLKCNLFFKFKLRKKKLIKYKKKKMI